MTEGNILIVDDDAGICTSAQLFLKQYYSNVFVELNPKKINSRLDENQIQAVLLDMNFQKGRNDGTDGFFYLSEIKKTSPNTVVIFMTAYGDIDLAVQAIRAGAMDFVTKPWKNDKLLLTVEAAMQLAIKNQKISRLEAAENHTQSEKLSVLDHFIGESPRFTEVRSVMTRVAPTDAGVLLTGDNGTGKGLAATYIHEKSNRSDQPLITIDLGSLNENLIESELFGYTKGAFTDAKKDKIGRFELANKGTLFLDEIANLSLSSQAKLLSALQNQVITPIGSNKHIKIDVRLICATNADLPKLVAKGKFRQDLLFRINTIEIMLPSLSKRREDIPALIEHYLNVYRSKYGKPHLTINKTVMKALKAYDWPGNIRELQHATERAVILSESPQLESKDFIVPNEQQAAEIFNSLNLKEMELTLIKKALEKHSGNVSRSAKELGIDRLALYRRMEKYGL